MKRYKLTGLSLFTKTYKHDGYTHHAYIIILTIIIFSFSAYSQKQNNIWCFGDSAGIDFNNVSNPITFSSSLDSRGSCVSIAGTNGQLLFYASNNAANDVNSTKVWDRNHVLMENGDSIIGEAWYSELIILPFPGDEKKYYLFSLGILGPYGLYYSIIDMSYNGGLGKVVQKNIQLQTYKAWDAMAAVRHANGRDWWLITKDYNNSLGNKTFHVNLITPFGIQDSVQSIGGIEFTNGGMSCFSKDGNKFLFTSIRGLIEVMDFDRCTGQFSNPLVILNSNIDSYVCGAAFAPNGNLVYIATNKGPSYVLQFDLLFPNVFNSRDTIARTNSIYGTGGALRLAPDDKIYWTCAWINATTLNYPYVDSMYHTENMNLSVINDPDVLGAGCNFSLYSFNLGGKRTYWGLPNNPDYGLGPIWGSVCDTILSNTDVLSNSSSEVNVFYHPDWESVFVNVRGLKGRKILLSITDLLSHKLIVESENITNGYFTKSIPVVNLSKGIYLITIETEKERLSRKILIY